MRTYMCIHQTTCRTRRTIVRQYRHTPVGSDEGEPLTYEDVLRSHKLQPVEASKNASTSENGMKNT